MPAAASSAVSILLQYAAAFAGMHLILRRGVGLRSLLLVAFLGSLFVLGGPITSRLSAGDGDILPAMLAPFILSCVLRSRSAFVRAVIAGAALSALLVLEGATSLLPALALTVATAG